MTETYTQSEDFKEESISLYEILKNEKEEVFNTKTQFKDWTINDVIYHLQFFNYAAYLSLTDEEKFSEFINDFYKAVKSGISAREYEKKLSNSLSGKELINLWKDEFSRVAEAFSKADPKKRVKWAGPDMSVRSSISARHMETWSHGQEVFDQLGIERINTDRIKNIVIIGINTFGWTFINRSIEVPKKVPMIILNSPSNKKWEWNTDNNEDSIIGDATEFCQVVTQVRNIKDTNLKVEGNVAEKWMSIAQCFAGPPEDPPIKGSRYIKEI